MTPGLLKGMYTLTIQGRMKLRAVPSGVGHWAPALGRIPRATQ